MTFSGPVLAVAEIGEHVLYASGNKVINSTDNTVIVSLSPSTIVHNIRVVSEFFIINGSREVVILSTRSFDEITRITCRDWVLSTTIVDEQIFCAVMHNRVEVYSFNGSLVAIVDAPIHALLYSAEIRPGASGDIEVFGGGVLSSLYHWTFSVIPVISIKSSFVHNVHKGSIFRIRSRGDELLTTSDDRTVILWQKSNESFLSQQVFRGHLARVWDSTWFEDTIVTASEDSLVRVFNYDAQCVMKLSGHSRDVRCLAVSNRGIFSGGEDGCVRLWSPKNQDISHIDLVTQEHDWVRHVELINDSRVLAVTAFGNVFVGSENFKPTIPITTTCAQLVFQSHVVLGLASGRVVVFDLATKTFSEETENIVPQRVCSIFELNNSGHIVVWNHCGVFGIVDIITGTVLVSNTSVSSSAKLGSMLCSLKQKESTLFADDKGSIVCVNTDGEITSRANRAVHGEKLLSLRTANDSSLQVTTSEGNSFSVDSLTLDRSSSVQKHSRINYLCGQNGQISWGFSAEEFLVVDKYDTVQWRYKCGGHRRPYDLMIRDSEYVFVHASSNRVTLAKGKSICKEVVSGYCGDLVHAVVRIGELVFTGCEDNAIRRIEMKKGQVELLRLHEGSVRALCSIESKRMLVSGGARSKAFMHALNEDGKLQTSYPIMLPQSDDDVRIMGIAATNSTVCLVDSIARIHLCDVENGKASLTIIIDEIANSVCLSVASDGHMFFVGAGNGFVVVMGPDGVQKCSKRIHQNGVNAIACIQPGLMVSVSDDQSIAIWRFEDQIEVISHVNHASPCSIRAVAVFNTTIVITGTDRRVSVFHFDGISLVRRKAIPTAVTDPLAITMVGHDHCIVAGRGIESIRLE